MKKNHPSSPTSMQEHDSYIFIYCLTLRHKLRQIQFREIYNIYLKIYSQRTRRCIQNKNIFKSF